MTAPSVCEREQRQRWNVPREAQKAKRTLRIVTINASGVKYYSEQPLACFARERLDRLVIQDAQIKKETVINRCTLSQGAVKAHIVGNGDHFHSQLIMVRQELEVSV